ncbi:hypothetical protein [Desulfovibrio aminophilus]|uniref:hypothetical protein n=1 Tax=Desulfovibrio aminophilus TaxID=81425 RepID=UPI00339A990E
MGTMTPEQLDEQKKLMYEKLAPRRRKFVDKIGYENWDPFQKPFDPIDIRRDVTGHTPQELYSAFIRSRPKPPTPDYASTIAEFTVVMIHNSERMRPIYDFCLWYSTMLEKYGKTL